MRKLITVLMLASLLSACGFHLQGSRPLPQSLQKLRINFEQPFDVVQPSLIKHLQAEAERRGAWVVNEHQQGTAQLRILELEHRRDDLSVNPDTGDRVESLLSTRVEFELLQDGEVLIPEEYIVVFRELLFDGRAVIAEEYEDDDTREEMQRELARLIFLRLEARLAAGTG